MSNDRHQATVHACSRTAGTVGIRMLAIVGVVMSAHTSRAAPGDWPEPRQNPHLTGLQPVPGRMTRAPQELATLELGCVSAGLTPVARPDGSTVGLLIAAGALRCYDAHGRRLWEAHPRGLNFTQIVAAEDLDGDGHAEVVLQAGRPAHPYGAAVMVSLDDGRVLWRYDVEPVSYEWYLYTGSYLPAPRPGRSSFSCRATRRTRASGTSRSSPVPHRALRQPSGGGSTSTTTRASPACTR